jgi:mRNA interferase MazF
MERGEIWWVDLPVPEGSEPGFPRPVLIVQAASFNRSSINTVLVATVSTNLGLGDAPGNLLIYPEDSGLPEPSVVNVSQLLTINRRRLHARTGQLSRPLLALVDDGLRLVLELG